MDREVRQEERGGRAWRTMGFLRPFLNVVRSEEASGPITGVALTSLIKFIEYGLLGDSAEGRSALAAVAETATHCRFEATDASSDEVVLMKILQVLLACLRSRGGRELSGALVHEMVHTAYRMSIQPRFSELLRRVAMRLLVEMVEAVCAHYRRDPPPPGDESTAALSTACVEPEEGDGPVGDDSVISVSQINEAEAADAERTVLLSGEDHPSPSYVNPHGVQFLPREPEEAPVGRFGQALVMRLFRLFADISCPDRGGNSHLSRLLGLQLIACMLEVLHAPGDADVPTFMLLPVVQADLGRHLINHMQSSQLSVAVMAMRVFSLLVSVYGDELKMQTQVFLLALCALVGDRRQALEHRELALDVLQELCARPGFATDAFLNFDCDVQCADVFEVVCGVLHGIVAHETSPSAQGLHAGVLECLEACLRAALALTDDDGDPDEACALRTRKARMREGAATWLETPKRSWACFQDMGLLPAGEVEAATLAALIHENRFLDQHAVGEFLGKEAALAQDTLRELTCRFDFRGVPMMDALRAFLQRFWLPKESQQIYRVVEAFTNHYYQSNPGTAASDEDILMLIYSIVMLNVDLHNEGVTRKMSKDVFARNFREAFDGDSAFSDRDLAAIYDDIRDNELRIEEPYVGGPISRDAYRALCARGALARPLARARGGVCSREVFRRIRLPLVAALCSALGYAASEPAVATALAGIERCARVAAAYRLHDALDHLVIKLCNFSRLVELPRGRVDDAVHEWGQDLKARMALHSAFAIARRHGAVLHDGWSYVMECVATLNELDLLPMPVMRVAGLVVPAGIKLGEALGAPGEAAVSTPSQRRKTARATSAPASYSLLGWLSGGGARRNRKDGAESDGGGARRGEVTPEQLESEEAAIQTVEQLGLHDLLHSSEQLPGDELIFLIKACMLAMRPKSRGQRSRGTLKLLLDLLAGVALLNRGRIGAFWVLLHELYVGLLSQASEATVLVRHSVDTLCVLVANVVPEAGVEGAAMLQNTFGLLVLELHDDVLRHLIGNVVATAAMLVRQRAAVLAWPAVQALVERAVRRPKSLRQMSHALATVVPDALEPSTFAAAGKALYLVVHSRECDGESCREVLEAMFVMYSRSAELAAASGDAAWEELTLPMLQTYVALAGDPRGEVRSFALTYLQRALLSDPTAALSPAALSWAFERVLFPLLTAMLSGSADATPDAREEVLSRGAVMLSKVFLQYMARLREGDPSAFHRTWTEVLAFFEILMAGPRAPSEAVAEAVFESLKNLLLVLHTADIDPTLLHQSWERIDSFCPSLRPELENLIPNAAHAASRE